MILETGNIWNALDVTDLLLITANATLRKDNCLVMGRGLAKEAAQRYPWLPRHAGDAIKECGLSKYGLITITQPTLNVDGSPRRPRLGLFQVKYHWYDNADLELIAFSTRKLTDYLKCWNWLRVDLNYPGIGNGRLLESVVYPIIKGLPDNVHVWKRA